MRIFKSSVYLKQVQMMVQDILVYRANFFFRFINWSIRFFILIFLWTAIFAAKEGEIAGFSLEDTITYFLLIQIVTGLSFSRGGFQISNDIQSGELSGKIILPVNYLYLKMSQDFGQNIFFFLMNTILYGVLGYVFRDYLSLNFNLLHILYSMPILTLSYIISFGMIALIGMLAFWLSTATRLIFMYFAIHSLLSGFLIPLNFFPEVIQNIIKWTPFPYNYYYATSVIQSSEWTPELTFGLYMTIFYAFVMLVLMKFIFHLGIKKYEAVGN
jgi:ABC-2 type transport system permease protein